MRIVKPDRLILTEHFCYRPFTRYIVSDYEHLYLSEHTPNTKWEWSSFNPFERRYGGQDLSGKRVCIYRHNAYGDQLMASAVPRYLKYLYPTATVHFYCHPSMLDLWAGNEFIGGAAIPIPLHFDVAREYNYHIFYEGMMENNSEFDQACCYDDFFGWIGLTDVPPEFKRPCIHLKLDDEKDLRKLGVSLKGRYMVYQLSPANPNRCYPVEKGMAFVRLFATEHRDWRVIVVGLDPEHQHTKTLSTLEACDNVLNLVDRLPSFRDMVPLVEHASLVVCPDSSVLHLAACFPNVPIVSLWGLFHPNDRAQYYTNNHAMFPVGACPHMPCRNHDFTLPREKCMDADGWDGKHCRALEIVEPETLLAEVESLVGSVPTTAVKPTYLFPEIHRGLGEKIIHSEFPPPQKKYEGHGDATVKWAGHDDPVRVELPKWDGPFGVYIVSCHATLEYDQAQTFLPLGWKVWGSFDVGNTQRPKIPNVTDHSTPLVTVQDMVDMILLHQCNEFPKVMKDYGSRFPDKLVVLNAFGQGCDREHAEVAEYTRLNHNALVVAYSVKDYLVYLHLGVPDKQLFLIRFGKDFNEWHQWYGLNGLVLVVGNDIKERGVDCGSLVLDLLISRGVPLVHVGKNSDKYPCGEGDVSYTRLRDWYMCCACTVSLGTKPAPMVLSLIESLCSGAPTIMYDNGCGVAQEGFKSLVTPDVESVVANAMRCVQERSFAVKLHEAAKEDRLLFDNRKIGKLWKEVASRGERS